MGSLLLGLSLCFACTADWGFFGHRQINRHAVYIVPPPLNIFFKRHVEWLEEHGVDADKRRYALPQEYKRHYIDLDHHAGRPQGPLSYRLDDEIRTGLAIRVLLQTGDTLELVDTGDGSFRIPGNKDPIPRDSLLVLWDTLRALEPQEESWYASEKLISERMPSLNPEGYLSGLLFEDRFSIHGILPYWLEIMQRRLTKAFMEKDNASVLRLAADMGHYIGDAHVPLHTTSNYNGQQTKQQGIHAFWESRIPELFYREWDMVTGPADYLPDFRASAWAWVKESSELVSQVLEKEREVRSGLPPDRVMCYEDRGGINTLTYCPEFARAYAEAMDGMVEARFRATVHAVASAWYTAWVDAGQPYLWEKEDEVKLPEEAGEVPATTPYGRPHE